MKTQLTQDQLADYGLTHEQLALLQRDYDALVARHLDDPSSDVIGVAVTTNPYPTSPSDGLAIVLLLRKEEPQGTTLYPDRTERGWKVLTRVTGDIAPLALADGQAVHADPELGTVFREKRRPVPGGVSVGPSGGETGTLGCQVISAGVTYMLSNNHVLAGVNSLTPGTPITQPGAVDGGGSADSVGTLTGFLELVPYKDGGKDADNIDAALASYNQGIEVSPLLLKGEGAFYRLSGTTVTVKDKACVQKSGRTTGYTTATVSAVGGTLKMQYKKGGPEYKFTNLILVDSTGTPFAAPGDSGSLVSTLVDNHPAGLLFAGNDTVAAMHPIDRVLQRLAAITGHAVTIHTT